MLKTLYNDFLTETRKRINEKTKIPYTASCKFLLVYHFKENGNQKEASLCLDKGYHQITPYDFTIFAFDMENSIGVLRSNKIPVAITKTDSGKVKKITLENLEKISQFLLIQ